MLPVARVRSASAAVRRMDHNEPFWISLFDTCGSVCLSLLSSLLCCLAFVIEEPIESCRRVKERNMLVEGLECFEVQEYECVR
jgi:hypothetical protein